MLTKTNCRQARCEQKSLRLFNERKICSLARQVLTTEYAKQWLDHALSIQTAIYDIDFHFEETEHIFAKNLNPMWNRVEIAIRSGLLPPVEHCWIYLDHLRQYELTEKRIHAGDTIDPQEYSKITSFKISDVAIARALIWSYSERSLDNRDREFWSRFDECNELIEDLRDVFEDGANWNFNFWLYTYMTNSSLMIGVYAAKKTLRRKLYELEFAYCKLKSPSAKLYRTAFSKVKKNGSWVLESGWLNILGTVRNHVKNYSDLKFTKTIPKSTATQYKGSDVATGQLIAHPN